MNVDTPDYQRGVVNSQQLLGSFTFTTPVGTVTIPPNVEGIWVILGQSPDPTPSVVGVSTGVAYATYGPLALQGGSDGDYMFFCPVTSDVDQQVTITWSSGPGAHWYVVGDTGGRFVIDAAIAQAMATPGVVAPAGVVQVGGTDGTDLHAFLTDGSGRLEVTGSTFPPVYAAPGAALPTDALLVGGTDGTDLRPFLTDTLGHALTIDQNLKNTTAALNAAQPADAVLVGGSDGTDLRALLTNAAGWLTVDAPALDAAISTPAGATPAKGLQATGTDSVDARVLRTNQQGVVYTVGTVPDVAAGDHPPNELQAAAHVNDTGGTIVVAAPGAGKRIRVFSASLQAITAAAFVELFDSINSASFIAAGTATMQASFLPSGLPLSANAAVTIFTSAGNATWAITYTIETI